LIVFLLPRFLLLLLTPRMLLLLLLADCVTTRQHAQTGCTLVCDNYARSAA